MKNVIAVVVLVGMVFTSIAKAEPTPSIRYLMNEPVSLFDRGMDKLDEKLKNLKFKGLPVPGRPRLSSYYDRATDMLVINFSNAIPGGMARDGKQAREWCILATNTIRQFLDPHYEGRRPLGDSSSPLKYMFTHSDGMALGPEKRNVTMAIGEELDRITELRGSMLFSVKPPKLLMCKSLLLGEKFSFEEKN